MVLLELLIRNDPSCGTMVTFMQFLFIAAEGFVNTTKFFTRKPVIPLKSYVLMVLLFFLTSVVNNYAFAFNVSMPLHLIFRSGSLVANMILGFFILRKRYNSMKCISVIMITAGICLATLASVGDGSFEIKADHETMDLNEFFRWISGIFILTMALFMSALMGLYQETVYRKHGKHPSEALFYNHAMPLPFFLLFHKDILHHVHLFNQSEPLLPGIIPIPVMWVYIIGNMITQYMCIKSVFVLTTECPSLTVTLVVTLRKFISLLFSIFYFGNAFTAQHWFGTIMVFGGTFLFADLHGHFRRYFSNNELEKKCDSVSQEELMTQKLKIR